MESVKDVLPFGDHWVRYNSKVGRLGENKTTHCAEVRFPGQAPSLAIVKAFRARDHRWVNEVVGWVIACELGIPTPPHAMVLAAGTDDLKDAKEQELVHAREHFAPNGEPVIFWCCSRLAIQPPQIKLGKTWEKAVLKTDEGRKLAAMDGWTGNCDRIEDNAPYWVTAQKIAAIDHERLAFAQDWTQAPPAHHDTVGRHTTHLLKKLKDLRDAKRISNADFEAVKAGILEHSLKHSKAFLSIESGLRGVVEKFTNSQDAAERLFGFLGDRVSDRVVRFRLGALV